MTITNSFINFNESTVVGEGEAYSAGSLGEGRRWQVVGDDTNGTVTREPRVQGGGVGH